MALAPIPFTRPQVQPQQPQPDDSWELLGVQPVPPQASFPAVDSAPAPEVAPAAPLNTNPGSADNFELIGMTPQGDQSGMNEFDRIFLNPARQGVEDLKDLSYGVRRMLGLDTAEEYARGIVENELRRQAVPQHPDDVRFSQELDAAEGWDAVGKIITNPRLWAQTSVRSLIGNAAPSLVLGGAGAAVGGVGGAALGGAAGSFLGEFNASVMDALREVDPNIVADPQALLSALNDDQIMGRAKDYALKRGLSVAAFDGISMGLAGRVFSPVAKLAGGKVLGTAAGLTAEGVMQAGLGSAGEATAQLASTGEIGRPGDVALEALAEVPGGLVEAITTGPGHALHAQNQPQTRGTPILPEAPPPVPTVPVDNPYQQTVDPATFVPPMPTAPAPAPVAPVAAAPVTVPEPQSFVPIEPAPAPIEPSPVAAPVQSEPVQVQPATPVLPPQPQAPVAAPVQPEPVQAQPVAAPVEPAPVAAPEPVQTAPEPQPQPAPVPEPAPQPEAPTVSGTNKRGAPDEHGTNLRYGNAIAWAEAQPTAGMTGEERRISRELFASLRTKSPREDETPQQYRIGDQVRVKGDSSHSTILGVKSEGGVVRLDLAREGRLSTGIKAEVTTDHRRTAQDNPGTRPKWFWQAEPNERGVKPGQTVTLKNGRRGRVVGVWKSEGQKSEPAERSASQLVVRPVGAKDGDPPMVVSRDLVQTKDGKKSTEVKPGDTVTLGNGRQATVSEVWPGHAPAGPRRAPQARAVNVAIQAEGEPDGKYRMTGLDGIDSIDPDTPSAEPTATTSPAPEPTPEPEPAKPAGPEPVEQRQQVPDPNPDTYVDHMPWQPTKRPLGAAAKDEVLTRGRAEDKEFLVGLDADGKVVAFGSGQKKSVSLSATLQAALADPDERVVAHHNHPSNSSFSMQDILMFYNPGLAGLWAHGHGGNSYYVERTSAARAMPAEKWTRAIGTIWKFVMNEVSGQPYLRQEHFPLGVNDLILEVLQRAGLVHYKTDYAMPKLSKANAEQYEAFKAELASTLRSSSFLKEYLDDAPADDGRAQHLGHPGNLGTVDWLGEGREDAGRPEASHDRNGRGRGREEEAGQVPGRRQLELDPDAAGDFDGTETIDTVDTPDFEGDYGVYKDDRRGRGTLAPQTIDVAYSSGPSPFRAAYIAAGLDPDEGNNLAPRRKIEVLRQVLVNTFGFANVRWAGADAQHAVAQMQNAFRNVQYMMHVLGLPIKAVSLDGSLTVALENERRRYFGVYDPSDRSIGMPGQSNSFAHEWMHALDHYLGDKLKNVDRLLSKIARRDGLDTTNSIEEAFVNLLYTMFYDKADVAARALDLERKAAATIQNGPKAGQPTVAALEAQRQLEQLKAGSTMLRIKPTDYAMKSRDFDPGSDYWASVHEMLARAFEAYVASKVAMAGGTNEFITKGEEAYLSNADRRLAMTFPKDQDRVRIFAAFDQVFDHLRQNAVLGNEAPASKPTDDGIVDPNHWNKVASRQSNPDLFDQMREEARRLKNLATTAYQNGFIASLKNGVSTLSLNLGINKGANLATAGKSLLDYTRFWLFTTRGATMPLINRNKAGKNKKAGGGDLLEDAFGGFATRPGTGVEQLTTYEGESHQQTAKDMTKIENALRGNGFPDLHMSEKDQSIVREIMFGRRIPGADPRHVKLASALRDLFDAAHARAKAAGIKIGYLLDQGYLPRILDMGKVGANVQGFIDKASEVYRLVFDNLLSDPEFTERDLIDLANITDKRLGNTTGVNRFAAEIKALKKALRTLSKAEGELKALRNNKQATQAQIKAAEGKRDAAQDDVADARDELADVLRDPFAELSARDWHTAVQIGNSFTYEGHGPGEKYTQHRKLPPEADDILADFYNTDPVNLTANYVGNMNARVAYVKRAGNPSGTDRIQDVVARPDVQNRIAMNPKRYTLDTEAGRRAIISDLANPATDNLLEMRLRSAFEMGADPKDVTHVRRAVESIAGRGERGLFADMLQRFSGLIYAYTYIRLLPRMAVTSLTEPATVMLRTGSLKATFSTFTSYMQELNQKAQSVRERQEIARAIGLISSPLYDVLLMSRMGMDTGHIASPNVIMARFFAANFAASITNAQRRASMIGGFVWMRDMAQKHALSTDEGDKRVIEAEFLDLGIREADLNSFMDWLRQSDQLPDLAAMNSKAGRVFEQAVFRFVGQVIQEPNRADKPMLASTALGRLAFSLTSYLYAFFSNVHAATVSRTIRDYKIYKDVGHGKLSAGVNAGAGAAASFVGGFAIIWLGQMLTSAAREFLFNHEQWDKHEDDDDLFAWLAGLATSRTGIAGPADVILNSLTGLKYERDLSNMVVGPGIQSVLGDLSNIVRLFSTENSPNTNTAEREAAKALYRLAIAPTFGALLSATNTLGPISEAARYTGLVSLTSNGAASIFADWVAGEKKDKDAKPERPSAAERRADRDAKREKDRAKRAKEREERRKEREIARAGRD